MSNNNKLLEMQYMKTAALILVVYGHVLTKYTSWYIYEATYDLTYDIILRVLGQLHTTCFTYCSGFIFGYLLQKGKYKEFIPFIKNKTTRLLIPWGIYGLLRCALASCSIKTLLLQGHHVWFLFMLFQCFSITWFIDKYFYKYKYCALFLIVICLISILRYPLLDIIFGLNGLQWQYPFFFAGYILVKSGLFNKNIIAKIKNKVYIISIILFLFILYLSISSAVTYTTDSYRMFNGIYIHLTPLLSLLLIVSIHVMLMNYSSSKKLNNIVSFMDKYSFRIYLIHPFLIITVIERFDLRESILCSIVAFLAVFILSAIYSVLINKIPYIRNIL